MFGHYLRLVIKQFEDQKVDVCEIFETFDNDLRRVKLKTVSFTEQLQGTNEDVAIFVPVARMYKKTSNCVML